MSCSLPQVAEKALISAGTPVLGRQIACPAAFQHGRLRCHTVRARQTAVVRAGGNESNGSQEGKKPGVSLPGLHSSNVMLSSGTEPSCLCLMHFSAPALSFLFRLPGSVVFLQHNLDLSAVLYCCSPLCALVYMVNALNGREPSAVHAWQLVFSVVFLKGHSTHIVMISQALTKEWWSTMQFGYTRKDVILLGGGIFGVGYGLYYGLQAAGYDALVAGNIVQIFVFLGIGVGYISTYIFRVANKVRAAAIALRHQAICMLPVCLEIFLRTCCFLS